jgi:hypothetical protein
VAKVRHEGNIEEARRRREKTRQQDLAFWHGSYELRGRLLSARANAAQQQ